MPAEAWSRRGITIAGEETMSELLFIRWREADVHHADLGLGYSWSDWDPEYVRLDLVRLDDVVGQSQADGDDRRCRPRRCRSAITSDWPGCSAAPRSTVLAPAGIMG